MYLHSREKQAVEYQVIDLDKKEVIQGVIWADDEKGEYECFFRNEKGQIVTEIDKTTGQEYLVRRHKKGNIKIVKKEELNEYLKKEE